MFNTSILDNSSMLAPFSVYDCLNEHHCGIIVSCIAMLLCFSLGTTAHSWILWFYLRAGWKTKPTQLFFLNHTFLDLTYCIDCILEILNLLIFKSDQFWIGTYMFFYVSCVGRPLMQICICFEQYLAVLHPIFFLKYKGIQYRIATALLVWLTVAGYAVYIRFTGNFRNPFFYFVFLAAVAVISFCCLFVLRALKHPGPGDTQITVRTGKDVGNQQKRNAFKIIFSGLLLILFSYLPPALLTFITMVKIDDKLFHCNIVPFIYSMNVLGVIIMPLLKMYRDGHLKLINRQRGYNVNR